MTDTEEILDAVPTGVALGTEDVATAIDACLRCAQTCANADLAEEDIDELRPCAALCITCADVCDVTANFLPVRLTGTSSSSTTCSKPASAHARTAPRSAPGALTIIVTARSARTSARPAATHASRCSTPTPWTMPRPGRRLTHTERAIPGGVAQLERRPECDCRPTARMKADIRRLIDSSGRGLRRRPKGENTLGVRRDVRSAAKEPPPTAASPETRCSVRASAGRYSHHFRPGRPLG